MTQVTEGESEVEIFIATSTGCCRDMDRKELCFVMETVTSILVQCDIVCEGNDIYPGPRELYVLLSLLIIPLHPAPLVSSGC